MLTLTPLCPFRTFASHLLCCLSFCSSLPPFPSLFSSLSFFLSLLCHRVLNLRARTVIVRHQYGLILLEPIVQKNSTSICFNAILFNHVVGSWEDRRDWKDGWPLFTVWIKKILRMDERERLPIYLGPPICILPNLKMDRACERWVSTLTKLSFINFINTVTLL